MGELKGRKVATSYPNPEIAKRGRAGARVGLKVVRGLAIPIAAVRRAASSSVVRAGNGQAIATMSLSSSV